MKKRILSIFTVLLMCLSLSTTAFAAPDTFRLYDEADLLTDSEERSLLDRLDSVSETYKVDVLIVTLETIDGYLADEYIEAFYDINDFGYGENRDGVLLLIAMEEREYRILSNGFGADAISPDDIDYIGDMISYDLSEGYYADAFHSFIDECEYEINGEINGFPFDFTMNLLTSLVIGLIVAFIATGIMRGKLKSVERKPAATEYIKSGSMQITTSKDLYLYRTVNRRRREKNTSSSSSGSSRNVGGGKF